MRFKLHFEGGLYQIQDSCYYSNAVSLDNLVSYIKIYDSVLLCYPLQNRTYLNSIVFEFGNIEELKTDRASPVYTLEDILH